ncbi:MAG: hypothetical protein K8T91_07865 [Planctomycetes bacterium]|nr:hypothetical protein [Planctomycetota bacterium]
MHSMFLRHAHWLNLFVLLLLLPGCRRSDHEISSAPGAEEGWARLPDQPALEVQRDSTRVLAARVSGGAAVSLVKGMAAVEDKMVLEVAPGQVVVVRQPSAIAKEVSSLAHVYIRDGEETLVTTEGFKGEPYVDPKDRKLCWSARTCVNPACPGQKLATAQRPFLYSVRVPQFLVNEKGEVTTDGSEFSWPSVACPQCGQVNSTKNYCSDEVSRRREELAAELQKARELRDQAQRASP